MEAFIVEDELNNIELLNSLLRKYCPKVKVIGSAQNFNDAYRFLLNNKIEILFLDIELPGKNGFEILKILGSKINFHVIFVTAFSVYALQAIKFSALDYLLKPVQISDLIEAVKKAEHKISQSKKIELLLKNIHLNEENNPTIAIPQFHETIYLKLNEIIYCESQNNYTKISLKSGEKILVSKGIFEFDALLAPLNFIRCHRSFLINKVHVKKLIRRKTEWIIIMSDASKMPVARSKKLRIQIEFNNLM